jgi:heptosyltransferase-2
MLKAYHNIDSIIKKGILFIGRIFFNSVFLFRGMLPTVIPPKEGINRILVLALNKGIGDAILYEPALRSLRKSYPFSQIAIVVNPYVSEVVKRYEYLDEIIVYDETGKHRGLLEKFKFVRILRRKRFDVAIDFLHNNTLPILCYFSGAKHLVGFDIGKRGMVFNHRVQVDLENKHAVELSLELVKAVGAKIEYVRLELASYANEQNFASEFLRRRGIRETDLLIGFHPGARDDIDEMDKRWPVRKYAELADILAEQYGAKVIVFGGSREIQLGQEISRNTYSRPIMAIGETTIGESIALIERCDMLICNNSGLMHIAVALGVPTISFAGGVRLERWRPYGDASLHKVVLKPGCEICRGVLCETKGQKCLEQISVSDVLKITEMQLKNLRFSKII